ncbi:MAG: hypothetical protein ACXWDO_00250 [Bacteroidia bacterium]
MPKQCIADKCTRNVWAKKYCRFHQWMRTDKKPKAPKPIAPKRAVQNKLYEAKKAIFFASHKKCEINSPECNKDAPLHVHHTNGRENERLLNVDYWMAACDYCNSYIESHDEWARENGFKLSKFAPQPEPNAQVSDTTGDAIPTTAGTY